ncbi:MAG: hypothetical protein HYY16_16145 [Planctomycetes bacterium]|nr:hypothetical protein [Planctomycetota bacterium]
MEMPEGVSYEGVFGEKGVGDVIRIAAWGVKLQATESGKVGVGEVEKGRGAPRFSLKKRRWVSYRAIDLSCLFLGRSL